MIQINELRIGNLISPMGKSFTKVEGFDIYNDMILSSDFAERTNDFFEPIPITEQWLVKFGFNCVNRPKMAFKLYHNEEKADFSSMILKEVGNNPVWVYAGNNRWTINPFTVELKYVHQLQNIYFALTGIDLPLVG